MTFKYKKELAIISIAFLSCFVLVLGIKKLYFNENEKTVNSVEHDEQNNMKFAQATTEALTTTYDPLASVIMNYREDEEIEVANEIYEYPYEKAPEIKEDGSIIYDGMTVTELTNKLNKSLGSYMTNTGYFFADYTRRTGLDPYLSVAIVLLETGCKWECSKMTVECNNIGGLKGSGSCNGTSYSKYDDLDKGIESYLNIIYYNYYANGLDTPVKMSDKYASSSKWAEKVNRYIEEIKSK